MNSSSPPPPPPPSSSASADELASAYLDDEVTPAERAQVETDPVLLARVAELRAVRDALAAPVPSRSAAERDAAIRTAMGTTGATSVAGGDLARPATPVALASRRRPGRSGRIALAVLGAAAAAVIAVVALTASPTDHDATSSATLATAAGPPAPAAASSERNNGPDATTGGSASTAAAGGAGQDTATPNAAAAVAGVPFLGSIDDADSLRAALTTASAASAAGAAASSSGEACPVAGAKLVAALVWQGTPAFVYVDGAGHAEVVSQAGCGRLADVPPS